MSDWSNVKNILCIRPDNMGDLVMSGPALRTLKRGLNARITALTSSMSAIVAPFIPEIDETIVFDLPWVKTINNSGPEALDGLIDKLKTYRFDAAVIFTVYSQNPLPSAMIAYQAGITKVLAYCRENPYGLISDWVAEEEPFHYIVHQVERDLKLVNSICAPVADSGLKLITNESEWPAITTKLRHTGFNPDKPWLILHAGVSEVKRQFPQDLWIETACRLVNEGFQLLLTGSAKEGPMVADLQKHIGSGTFNAAGFFSIEQLITLISHAPLLLSVNTGTVHLAAAVGTPVVVLYAQTNPQHTPWMVPNEVIEFPVPEDLKSKNGIIRYVDDTIYATPAQMPDPELIVQSVISLVKPPVVSDLPFHEIQHGSQGFPTN